MDWAQRLPLPATQQMNGRRGEEVLTCLLPRMDQILLWGSDSRSASKGEEIQTWFDNMFNTEVIWALEEWTLPGDMMSSAGDGAKVA